MADISKIKTLDGTTYDLKDAVARFPYVPVASVDATSTATAFTVQVPGITELKNGAYFYCYNGTVASKKNFTLNVNGLGAKPVYGSTGSRMETGFIKNKYFNCWYDADFISGGCWFAGYLSDANTTYSGMTVAEYTAGTSTTNRLISPACLKAAIELWGSDSDTVNGHTVESNVPANAEFTDTTYEAATSTDAGLMSSTDKIALDTINGGIIKKTFTATLDAGGVVQVPASSRLPEKSVVNTVVSVKNNVNACLGIYFVYPNSTTGTPFVAIFNWVNMERVTSGTVTVTLTYL